MRSWANTTDRAARTAKAREAKERKRLERHGNDPKRAEAALRADMIAMGRKSGQSRRAQSAALSKQRTVAEAGEPQI
jgi:hypothetical protein